jgi:hypothetical protein
VTETAKAKTEKLLRTYFIHVTSDHAEITFECDQADVKCLRVERIKLASGADVEQIYTRNRIFVDDGEILRPKPRGRDWVPYCMTDDHTIWRRSK